MNLEASAALTLEDQPATRVQHGSITALFSHQVSLASDRRAVICGDEALTYGELDARAEQLARRLMALGVKKEERVAVCLERSLSLVVTLLAIAKAGAAYLPLDPTNPSERVRFMLEDAGVRVLVTVARHAAHGEGLPHVVQLDRLPEDSGELPAPASELRFRGGAEPERLAYVCYTSGSTGTPKGVEVTQAGVLRLVHQVSYVALGPESVVLHAAPAAFDATTFELWGPLLTGGCAVLFPNELPTARRLREVIERHGVTTAFLTTALVNAVVDEDPHALGGLSQLLFGGEAVSVTHVARLQAACPQLSLVHVYGPTETTTFATAYAIRERVYPGAASIPIGSAIEETTLHVLDEHQIEVPAGVAGELYIGGSGVARGYLNRPELTEKRFVRLPGSGERVYRTGDIVRMDREGALTFVGRVDHQVKIRGHRIELGEIEVRLARIEGVRECVVLCREDSPSEKRLVAYCVPEKESALSSERLREELQRELPDYMVPKLYVQLEHFPLTANGKIDRARLPKPSAEPKSSARPPRREVERELAAIWCALLDLESIGVDEDFFARGGHSLLVTRVLARVRERFDVELSLAAMFAEPTIEATAPLIEAVLYMRDGGVSKDLTLEEREI